MRTDRCVKKRKPQGGVRDTDLFARVAMPSCACGVWDDPVVFSDPCYGMETTTHASRLFFGTLYTIFASG